MSNCKKLFLGEDDELSMSKMPYIGTQLRVDGYYYLERTGVKDTFWDVYFFYRDGVILYGGTFPIEEAEQHEMDYKGAEWISIVKKHKDFWGVFKIDGQDIQFERWYCGSGFCPAYIRSGTILNDTTFHITRSTRSNGTEVSDEDEIYRFKEFSLKPDSTNAFVN